MGRATEQPKLPRGVSIRQLKNESRVQIAFSYQGKQCRELLQTGKINKTSLEYAASLRAEIRRKIADGSFDYAAYFPDSPVARLFNPARKWVTLEALLKRQAAIYEKQAMDGTISASTLLLYTKVINNRLIPKWGHLGIADLSPVALRTWISQLGVTAKTVRNILTPLRSVLEDAVNDELIEINPIDRMALGKLLKQTARKSEYEVDPFTQDEVEKLLHHARADERPLVQFWLETGLRTGELLALTHSQVDFENKQLIINANIVTGMIDGKIQPVMKAPKTAAGTRTVDLSEKAMQALRQQQLLWPGTDRVWINPASGEPWVNESQLRKILWVPLVKRSKVTYRNPYQCRHTYASTLLTAGANPFWLASQMGHVDAEMVFKIYGKWIPDNYKKQSVKFTPNSHAHTSGEIDQVIER